MRDHPYDDRGNGKQREHIVIVGMDETLERACTLEVDQAADQGEIGVSDPDAVGAAGHPEELEGEAPENLRQRKRQDAEEDACMPHADETENRRNDQRAEHSAND